jgi:hypothetical protein
MRFGTWNVRSLYRAGSLTAAARELAGYKLDLTKIDELETNSKTKHIRDLYRGISDFKEVYQSGTNIVRYENGELFTDSHSILARWRNHFSQLFNVHGVGGVRQAEIQQNH